MRYRCDYSETNAAGQIIHYTKWMGGPSLAKVEGAKCPDGKDRTAFITGDACTFFSIPAYVHNHSRRVKGYLTCDDGVYRFHSNDINRHEVLPRCNNRRVKVGDLVGDGVMQVGRVIGWAERDGMGNRYPIPRLLVLQMSESMTSVFHRHWNQNDVTSCCAPSPEQGGFLAWFFGGPLAPAEELLKQEARGSLNSFFFSKNCRPDGGPK